MSGSDLAVAAVAVACFYALWWAYSLSVRLRRIERLSKSDSLTGLGSGDWLQTERWPAALRSGRPLGVVYLDLDHLKLTNDTRGHAAGDQYICTAADALRQAVRRGVDEVFRSYQAPQWLSGSPPRCLIRNGRSSAGCCGTSATPPG